MDLWLLCGIDFYSRGDTVLGVKVLSAKGGSLLQAPEETPAATRLTLTIQKQAEFLTLDETSPLHFNMCHPD